MCAPNTDDPLGVALAVGTKLGTMPATFKDYPAEVRREMAKRGEAMPDGSFPIKDGGDLTDAIDSYGRAGNKLAAKRHIIKRARALGKTDQLPEDWNVTTSTPDRLGEHYQVGFAEPPAGDGNISDWFPALHAGDHVYAGRDLKITEADLDRAVENFVRYWQPRGGVPVDYDHSFAEGGPSIAAGWIVEMERRGDTLYERVEWTAKAAEQIRNGEYRFYSAEFTSDWVNEEGRSEGFTILAGALTNRPFLRGLAPVALSQKVTEAAGEWALKVAADLIPGDASERDETRREVPERNDDKPTTFTVEIDGEEKELTSEEIVALHAKAAEAEKLKAAKGDQAEQVTKLSQRVDTLSKDLEKERFNAAFSQAQREGALDAKDKTREKWEARLEKFGLEATKELLSELPRDVIPVTERGEGGGQPRVRFTDDAPDDQDPAMYALNQRAQEILAEKPDLEGGYRAALAQAQRDLKAEGIEVA